MIGGNNEKKNIFIVNLICDLLDQAYPSKKNNITSYKSLIKFVKDRPGHDFRYAINARKIFKEIKWKPRHSFEEGIKKTVNWYLKEFLKNRKYWLPSFLIIIFFLIIVLLSSDKFGTLGYSIF